MRTHSNQGKPLPATGLRAQQSAPMRTATNFRQAREAAKAFQGKLLTNQASGIVAVLSRTNLNKMLSEKAVSKSESPALHAAAVANVDTLFARAVLGWSKPDRSDDPNIKAIHRFFALLQVDGQAKMVKLTVKEIGPVAQHNTIYTLEVVAFSDDQQGRQWVETAACEDGIDLDKEIPQRGEWEVEIAASQDNGPKTSLGGFLPEGSAAGDVLILAQAIGQRNRLVDNG